MHISGSRYWWKHWKHLLQWQVQWSSNQHGSRWKLRWIFQQAFYKWTRFKHFVTWLQPLCRSQDSKEKSFLSHHLVQSLCRPMGSPIHLAEAQVWTCPLLCRHVFGCQYYCQCTSVWVRKCLHEMPEGGHSTREAPWTSFSTTSSSKFLINAYPTDVLLFWQSTFTWWWRRSIQYSMTGYSNMCTSLVLPFIFSKRKAFLPSFTSTPRITRLGSLSAIPFSWLLFLIIAMTQSIGWKRSLPCVEWEKTTLLSVTTAL